MDKVTLYMTEKHYGMRSIFLCVCAAYAPVDFLYFRNVLSIVFSHVCIEVWKQNKDAKQNQANKIKQTNKKMTFPKYDLLQ